MFPPPAGWRAKVKWQASAAPRHCITNNTEMTTLPSEINAAAVKNSPAEKVTPMMQQCISAM
jgi:hypothetical protein